MINSIELIEKSRTNIQIGNDNAKLSSQSEFKRIESKKYDDK